MRTGPGHVQAKPLNPSPSPKRRTTLIALGFILALSAILSLTAIRQFRKAPFFSVPVLDERAYVDWAMTIASGEVQASGAFYQDPLYPYFLALVFKIFGKSFLMVRLIQAGLGLMSVYLVFLASRKLSGDGAALAAALIMALCTSLYFYELILVKASLVIFVSSAGLYLGAAAADRPETGWRFGALGLSIGLLSLLRGNLLLVIPLLMAWPLFACRSLPFLSRLKASAALVLGILMVVLPVTLRNYMVSGEVVLTTSQGGSNFYIGNNEAATGVYSFLPFVRANPLFQADDFRAEAERRMGRKISRAESSRFWLHEGLDWIKGNPAKAGRLWLHKVRLLIAQYEVPDNYDMYLVRRVFAPALWLPFLGFGFLWGPALIGMLVSGRRGLKASFPVLFALGYAASLVPFFIVSRYRLPLLPVLAIFSAEFLIWGLDKWRARQIRVLSLSLAGVGAALLLGLWPVPESRLVQGQGEFLLGVAYEQAGKPVDAIVWIYRASETMPGDPRLGAAWALAVSETTADDAAFLQLEADTSRLGPDQLYVIGRKLEELQAQPAAVKIYNAILNSTPLYFPAHERLALLYSQAEGIKDPVKALGHFRHALELRPDYQSRPEFAAIVNSLEKEYMMAGDTVKSRQLREEFTGTSPDEQGADEPRP